MLVRILFLLSLLISINTFASTSNQKNVLWEVLEATPKKTSILDDVVDATNLNDVVEATGRKLDYDRTPLDNKVYKARVNPRTPETKKAMGNTAMKKLLKTSGWGYAATVALESLLNGIDWVIDPEAQSIWRYKRTTNFDCKNFGYTWKSGNSIYKCPTDVFADQNICKTNTTAKDCQIKELWADQWHEVKVSDLPNNSVPERIDIEVQFEYNGIKTSNFLTVYKSEKIQDSNDKEILTDDALADYMLGTHKDFKDEKYKKDLPKPNTWTSVANVFKPENRFEEENSPTVKVVTTHLDQTNPESEDATVSPDKDPEGNPTGSFSLPPFCSWATPVCEFIKWFKDDPEKPEDDQVDIETPEEQELDDSIFSTNEQCPPDLVISYTLLQTHQITYSYQNMCNAFTVARPVVIFIGGLIALFILGGYRSSE